MTIWNKIKALLSKPSTDLEQGEPFDVERFIYVFLPGNIQPLERGERFEDKIDPALSKRGLGHISGGGSLMSPKRPDGTSVVESCGIDIDATDREEALELLRQLLPELTAPTGSELHYTRDGVRLKDTFSGEGWRLAEGREYLHPGFGV